MFSLNVPYLWRREEVMRLVKVLLLNIMSINCRRGGM